MENVATLAERNLLEVFNQPDQQLRMLTIAKIWARHGFMWCSEGLFTGPKGINLLATALMRRYPEYELRPIQVTDELANVARLRWSLGVQGLRPALMGEDIVKVTRGRIVELYRFMDGPAI